MYTLTLNILDEKELAPPTPTEVLLFLPQQPCRFPIASEACSQRWGCILYCFYLTLLDNALHTVEAHYIYMTEMNSGNEFGDPEIFF